MNTDFLTNPVITGKFKAKFYWTSNVFEDAERINRPHIKAEGENENRIAETIDIINELSGINSISLNDALNIQNRLLKANNWKGIKSGFRTHNVKFNNGNDADTPDFKNVPELVEKMFPIQTMPKEQLLEWYRQIQIIHPLSDLNGRTFGIIVAILNLNNKTK